MMDVGNEWTQGPSEQTSMQTHTHTHASLSMDRINVKVYLSVTVTSYCDFSEQWIQCLLLFFTLQSFLTLIFILSCSFSSSVSQKYTNLHFGMHDTVFWWPFWYYPVMFVSDLGSLVSLLSFLAITSSTCAVKPPYFACRLFFMA